MAKEVVGRRFGTDAKEEPDMLVGHLSDILSGAKLRTNRVPLFDTALARASVKQKFSSRSLLDQTQPQQQFGRLFYILLHRLAHIIL